MNDFKFYKSLSEKYRYKNFYHLNEEEISSYVEARMPATRAAITSVLLELKKRITCEIHTLLELGAGPGTGVLAAKEIFPELGRATLIEKEKKMIAFGKSILSDQKKVIWIQGDMRSIHWEKHDLVLFGYSFGELAEKDCKNIFENAWKHCSFLVIVEPGTPRGFERIKLARQWVLAQKGYLLAPCPHQNACPMPLNDWCHFSARLKRTKNHRMIKNASLGWEDEKFSYLIASPEKQMHADMRIIGHPIKRSGHITLNLCSKEGIHNKTISKKQKGLYPLVRKMKWGDELFFN